MYLLKSTFAFILCGLFYFASAQTFFGDESEAARNCVKPDPTNIGNVLIPKKFTCKTYPEFEIANWDVVNDWCLQRFNNGFVCSTREQIEKQRNSGLSPLLERPCEKLCQTIKDCIVPDPLDRKQDNRNRKFMCKTYPGCELSGDEAFALCYQEIENGYMCSTREQIQAQKSSCPGP